MGELLFVSETILRLGRAAVEAIHFLRTNGSAAIEILNDVGIVESPEEEGFMKCLGQKTPWMINLS